MRPESNSAHVFSHLHLVMPFADLILQRPLYMWVFLPKATKSLEHGLPVAI